MFPLQWPVLLFYVASMNDENELVTLLENFSSLVEEFAQQSIYEALDIIVDILVIEYEEFHCNNRSLSPSEFRLNSIHKARRVGTNSITTSRVNSFIGVNLASFDWEAPHIDVATTIELNDQRSAEPGYMSPHQRLLLGVASSTTGISMTVTRAVISTSCARPID